MDCVGHCDPAWEVMFSETSTKQFLPAPICLTFITLTKFTAAPGGFRFPFFARRRKDRIMGTPQANYKVIFSRVDEPGDSQLPVSKVTGPSAKMTPIVIANVRDESPEVESVMILPHRRFWGDIPMPMF